MKNLTKKALIGCATLLTANAYADVPASCIITSSSAMIQDFDMSPFIARNTTSGADASTFLTHGSVTQPVGQGFIGFLSTYLASSTSSALPSATPSIPAGVVLLESTWFPVSNLTAPGQKPSSLGTSAYMRVPETPAWELPNEAVSQLTSLVPACDWVRYRWDYLSIRPFVLTQPSPTATNMIVKEIPTKGLTTVQLQNFLNDITSIVGIYGISAIVGPGITTPPSIYNLNTYGKLFRFTVVDLVTSGGQTTGATGKYMITLWGTALQ